MLLYKNFTYFKNQDYTLEATFYPASGPKKNKTILYLHGGGLIWGSRMDLPEPYIQLFLQAGYDFVTFDYPLAPESKLEDIVARIEDGLIWFHKEAQNELMLSSSDFYLFGRSAGAYLAFICGKMRHCPRPEKVISFYGYAAINQAFYLQPNPFYKKYPAIGKDLVDALIQTHPIKEGSLEKRYALYMYARQTGKWLDLVLKHPQNRDLYSLSKKDLAQFPPTFIAQSTADNDVPYRVGVELSLAIPNSKLITIQGLQHDFDHDANEPLAKEAYQALIDWLSQS